MSIPNKIKENLQKRFYANVNESVLGEVEGEIQNYLKGKVLDAGCGGGTWILRRYKSPETIIIGVDLYISQDKKIDIAVRASLEHLPFKSKTFDTILCHWVIEHLEDPAAVFLEFNRVLKNNGILIFKTVSIISPMIISRLTPFRFHKVFQSGGFLTFHRCNTAKHLDRCLKAAGFRKKMLIRVDQTYGYLPFFKFTYILGLLYSRAVNSYKFLNHFANGIIGIYQRWS